MAAIYAKAYSGVIDVGRNECIGVRWFSDGNERVLQQLVEDRWVDVETIFENKSK